MGKAPKNDKLGTGRDKRKAKYISRTAALKYLQLPLTAFRKLCILKGIFPYVVPGTERKKDSTLRRPNSTYYLVKDIRFIGNDPLIETIRKRTIYRRKLGKYTEKKDYKKVERIAETLKPTFDMERVVRERYPNFQLALEDMGDALALIGTFATLPKTRLMFLEEIKDCSVLMKQWHFYVVHARALRKAFLSVKGTYYQAEVEGVNITWIMPHKFTIDKYKDVDMKVMKTFLDLWTSLAKFVMYKLYHDRNMTFPPTFIESGPGLMVTKSQRVPQMNPPLPKRLAKAKAGQSAASQAVAAKIESLMEKKNLFGKDEDDDDEEETGEVEIDEDADPEDDEEEQQEEEQQDASMMDAEESEDDGRVDGEKEDDFYGRGGEAYSSIYKRMAENKKRLFENYVFFVSRECPLELLEFVILAFGGRVGSEDPHSTFKENATFITHEIVDRPAVLKRVPGRHYIQPQWVVDCVNAGIILPEERYRVGAVLPPHLSPFVDWSKEAYVPFYAREVQRMVAEQYGLPVPEIAQDLPVDEELERDQAEEEYLRELKAEQSGKKYSSVQADADVRNARKAVAALEENRKAAEEESQLAQTMLTGKKKKMFLALRRQEKKRAAKVVKITSRVGRIAEAEKRQETKFENIRMQEAKRSLEAQKRAEQKRAEMERAQKRAAKLGTKRKTKLVRLPKV